MIARRVTDALVEQFDCAFARIWLIEPDQTMLRLVASSGMYTHIDGSFARVPVGAYKVGKIAQNRVPFLSNHLADEPWVKDRDWAIANHIRGFAGYPLAAGDRVIGVLATFSHDGMAPEFLEVLQILCMIATVGLDAALQAQQSRRLLSITRMTAATTSSSLSDQLALLLPSTRVTLVGTEQPLTPALTHAFVRAAETLSHLSCNYCRLSYEAQSVALEAIVAAPNLPELEIGVWMQSRFNDLQFMSTCLGGTLQTQVEMQHKIIRFLITLPYPNCRVGPNVQIDCHFPVLQMILTHLAYLAGLTVCDASDSEALLLTDSTDKLGSVPNSIWIRHSNIPVPNQANAVIDWSVDPVQLRELAYKVMQGETVDSPHLTQEMPRPSAREQEIMGLLAQGLRDRDIAQRLYISESTVKFHINNSLTKLKAKNRYQAVYQAAIHGWI